MRRYGVKTRVSMDGEPLALSYAYPGWVKLRSLNEKRFWTEGTSIPGLFGMDKFDPGESKYLVITEGELDALSAWQMLQVPCVSVRSSSSAVRDVAQVRSWVQSFEHVFLCFDADGPGRGAARDVSQLLGRNQALDVKLVRHKDANEYLQAGDNVEFRKVWQAAKPYRPDNIVSDLGTFKKLLDEEPKWGVPYPYDTLTQMTYGIRTGEFVLITAQEGVGKSSLLRAIEHKILTETSANVGVIFPEETNKQHLESLVGLHIGKPAHLPGAGVTTTEKVDALEEILAGNERLFILGNGGGSTATDLADNVRQLVVGCSCRYILMDLINHNLSPSPGMEDERKAIDYLVTVLSMMTVELDFALIGTAHVNDNGDTRGSRYLAKAANIRIDLERDLDGGSSLTNLTVSKNRYAAKTGPAGSLKFDFGTYKLSEVANDNQEIAVAC